MTAISTSIANTLGIGSGIDTASLVSQLTAAVRAPKEQAITSRTTTNDARISALASATGALNNFSKALTDLLSGTGFSGQPASNDLSIATVSLLPGGVPTSLPAQLEVRQLASAQTLESTMLSAKTSPVGIGTLTLTAGGTDYAVTIDSTNNSLDGLAAAINAKGAGVAASVVTDNQGARLVLKGATGAANTFSLSATSGDTTSLQRFAFDGTAGGLTKQVDALDSVIRIDGIEMHNSGNTVDTAVPYVRIDLNKAAVGTQVTLASTQPTTSVRDLVTEFVTAYNTMKTSLNTSTAPGTETTEGGPLASDTGVRQMVQQLSRLTSTSLIASGPYRTLSDLGVSTNRDGTLAIDTKRLDAAIAANPSAVTQMLNPAVKSDANPGIAGALQKISDALQADNGALKSSQNKYTALQKSLADQLTQLNTDMTDYETRTAAIYAKMDSQLSALKATQSYLTQQIAAWNNSSN